MQITIPFTMRVKGICGRSGMDIFAVGFSGSILHYGGTGWSEMNSGTTNDLVSVWASGGHDVFAVGRGGIILHYDGNGWTSMSSSASIDLYCVWGSSSTDVYTIDWYGKILHFRNYDNRRWSGRHTV